MKRTDVLTIGAATLDVFLMSPEYDPDQNTIIELPLGTKRDIKDVIVSTGGGATNAAAAYRALGLKTATICRIGDDEIGTLVLNDLLKRKILTRTCVVDHRMSTGLAVLLSTGKKGRSILVHRGASASFRVDELPAATIKRTRWVHLTAIGGNFQVLEHIAACVSRYRRPHLAWNPGSKELTLGLKRLTPVLTACTILNVNKEEADVLLDRPTPVRRALAALHAITGGTVIITDGTKGATAIAADGSVYHTGIHNGIRPVEGTGSGDAFLSGVVASLIHRPKDLPMALQVGTANSESVIRKVGAKNGLLTHWPHAKLVPVRRLKA